MATLYISEYERMAGGNPLAQPVPLEPEIAMQIVAIGASSAQSVRFGSTTGLIRVHSDVICSIKIGTNPIATITAKRLAANQTEYFGVRGGDKVAVISNI